MPHQPDTLAALFSDPVRPYRAATNGTIDVLHNDDWVESRDTRIMSWSDGIRVGLRMP